MSQRQVIHAPELSGRGWLNTDRPLSLAGLRGKVVLLDFWTFCCINCLHVIEELRELEERFADELVVIGVHSPKFPHERDPEALARAVTRYSVTHPVLDDPDLTTWRRYGARAWPTLVLIDPQGYVAGVTSGEGVKEALARAIAEVVAEAEVTLSLRRGPLAETRPPPAPTGPLAFPSKVARDPETGLLAVSDTGHHRVVILSAGGDVRAVVGTGERRWRDGGPTEACFADPQGLVFHAGSLYVADTANHAIRRVDLEPLRVVTVAGTGEQARGPSSGGPARTTALNSPWDLAPFGSMLAVAMAGAHQLWSFDPEAGDIGVLAGSGAEALVDGPARSASLAQPSGLAAGPDGRLWVADSEASALRVVSQREDHLEVETVVGTGLFGWGCDDGDAASASLQHPLGVAVTPDAKVIVCDTYNSRLRIYHPTSHQVSSVPLEAGVLDEPSGAVAMPDGRLLVCDTNHHRLVLVELNLGAIEVLVPMGLEPPTFDLAVAELDPVVVRPGGVLRLVLKPKLIARQKLDPSNGQPLRIQVEGGPEAEGPGPRLELKVNAPAQSGELQVEATVVTCGKGDGATCQVDRSRLAIPVEIDKAGAPSAEVRL